jgi:AcrR family transcriptional regulator
MRKGEVTKLAILDEATDIASTVGLGGLTIGSLATKTELSKSGLFAHFQSKESLQLEVLRHARTRFVDLIIRPAITQPRGEPRLRALFDGWIRWTRGDVLPGGCPFIAAGIEFDDQPGAVREFLVSDEKDLMETVATVFRSGISEGHFREDADPEQFAQDVYGVVVSYLHFARLLGDPKAEQRARRSFDALLDAAR